MSNRPKPAKALPTAKAPLSPEQAEKVPIGNVTINVFQTKDAGLSIEIAVTEVLQQNPLVLIGILHDIVARATAETIQGMAGELHELRSKLEPEEAPRIVHATALPNLPMPH